MLCPWDYTSSCVLLALPADLFQGGALPASYEEGPRKGGLKDAGSNPTGHLVGCPLSRSTKKIKNFCSCYSEYTNYYCPDHIRPHQRTVLDASEPKYYNVDITALRETRFPNEGSLRRVQDIHTSGKVFPPEKVESSAGLAVHSTLLRNLSSVSPGKAKD